MTPPDRFSHPDTPDDTPSYGVHPGGYYQTPHATRQDHDSDQDGLMAAMAWALRASGVLVLIVGMALATRRTDLWVTWGAAWMFFACATAVPTPTPHRPPTRRLCDCVGTGPAPTIPAQRKGT